MEEKEKSILSPDCPEYFASEEKKRVEDEYSQDVAAKRSQENKEKDLFLKVYA
jgi:hypothetical protein